MASGGSSGRPGAGPRSYDLGSDDVLCSYDDFEASNGNRSDTSAKDFHENRLGRPFMNLYNQQEDYSREDIISTVEKCMKKYADNLLRYLEGISGRMSQLEVHCYKLERSIGELRADINRDQSEEDKKLKSLEKHLQEVHRSVQILRDKQELAEAQKELAKLQLSQELSPSSSHSKFNESSVEPSISESQKQDVIQDVPNQHLALALPHQIPAPSRASEKTTPAPQVQQDRYTLNQADTYYPHNPDIQYVHGSQVQNLLLQPPSQHHPHLTNQAQPQPVPQFQQQWPQQSSQQFPQQAVQHPQSITQAQIRPQTPPSYSQSPQQFPQQVGQPPQPVTHAQMRPQTPPSYPPYPPHQPTNSAPETFPVSSNAMQASYSAVPPSVGARPEAVPFSYGGPVISVSQPPPSHHGMLQQQLQPNQSSLGANVSKTGFVGTAAYASAAPQPNIQGYNAVYSIDGGRGAYPPNFQPGIYPPGNVSGLQSQQLPPGSNAGLHPASHSQRMRNHPYAETIDKAISMGYARDHVLSVVHRMEESGQPIDFNVLLDRLNSHASAVLPSRGGWSG